MIVVADDRVAGWVASHIQGFNRDFGNCVAMGVIHKDQIIAGIVYHNWDQTDGVIEVSGAATDKRWMTRPVVRELLAYPFGFCSVIVARTSPDNPSRSIWQRLGATDHIVKDGRGEGRDLAVLTLTKTQWLTGPFGGHDG